MQAARQGVGQALGLCTHLDKVVHKCELLVGCKADAAPILLAWLLTLLLLLSRGSLERACSTPFLGGLQG